MLVLVLGYALLQCNVPEGDLHCQCILTIFPASVHQFHVNILVFVLISTHFFILTTNLHCRIRTKKFINIKLRLIYYFDRDILN